MLCVSPTLFWSTSGRPCTRKRSLAESELRRSTEERLAIGCLSSFSPFARQTALRAPTVRLTLVAHNDLAVDVHILVIIKKPERFHPEFHRLRRGRMDEQSRFFWTAEAEKGPIELHVGLLIFSSNAYCRV